MLTLQGAIFIIHKFPKSFLYIVMEALFNIIHKSLLVSFFEKPALVCSRRNKEAVCI